MTLLLLVYRLSSKLVGLCVWLWIGHGMFASPYIQKVNQGTIRRTGSDRVCRGQPKDSEKKEGIGHWKFGETDTGGETKRGQSEKGLTNQKTQELSRLRERERERERYVLRKIQTEKVGGGKQEKKGTEIDRYAEEWDLKTRVFLSQFTAPNSFRHTRSLVSLSCQKLNWLFSSFWSFYNLHSV